jgi:hypothetical protein
MAKFLREPGLNIFEMMELETRSIDGQPSIAEIQKRSSVIESQMVFFKGMAQLTHDSKGFHAAKMTGLGLKIDSRPAMYELWWFAGSGNVYAVDVDDPDFVCRMSKH